MWRFAANPPRVSNRNLELLCEAGGGTCWLCLSDVELPHGPGRTTGSQQDPQDPSRTHGIPAGP